jgi:hypothetical protein
MEKVYFRHSVYAKNEARVTVAGVIVDGALKLGVSRCSPRDQFSRKKGRTVAEARARVRPSRVVALPTDQPVGKFFFEQAEDLILVQKPVCKIQRDEI